MPEYHTLTLIDLTEVCVLRELF